MQTFKKLILCIIVYNIEFSIQSSKCLLFFSLFLFAFELQNHSTKYFINNQVKTASKILQYFQDVLIEFSLKRSFIFSWSIVIFIILYNIDKICHNRANV